MSDSDTVIVAMDRLHALESLESSIPTLIEEAIAEYKRNNLKRLHEKDKANPKAVNERVKRYAQRHKDEINTKRREKRILEKQKKNRE